MENYGLFNTIHAVEGDGLNFSYGRWKEGSVLKGLNMNVERGVIYGLLGPSGCGKTTLLQCIVGRHTPNSGTIKIYGRIPGQKGFTVPGPGIGFMPQELALYKEISTEETLTYFGRLYRMENSIIKKRISFLVDFLDVPDKTKQLKYLSGGQQRRVSFAVALIHKPPLLILDEPTVGVDPLLRKSIWNHLQDLAARDSITVIITTHYVEEARQAQVVGFMRDGRILAESNPETLINHYNAYSLEDVFLKLCITDSEAFEALDVSENEKLNQEKDSLIPKPIRQHMYTEKNYIKNIVQFKKEHNYKIGLLNNTFKSDIGLTKDSTFIGDIKESSDRMNALINNSFVRLKRNIPLVFFQIFVPVFQVVVLCLCIGGEPFDIPIAVVNMEDNPLGESTSFLNTISSRTIHQRAYSNLSLAFQSVRRGENWGVLYIGQTFTDNLVNRFILDMQADNDTLVNSTIKIHLDMSNQQIATTVYLHLLKSFETFVQNGLKKFGMNQLISSPPIVLGEPIYGDLSPSFTEFVVPGLILCVTYIMAVGLSAISIIVEKKDGLLERAWVAGARSWEVIFSILFTLFIIMIFQVVLVTILTFLVFDIPMRGSLVWAGIAVLLAGAEGMCFGLFLSSIVNDEKIAMMLAMGALFPNILFSGLLWPVEAMPHYLRQFSYCQPLTLIAHTLRSILSRGWNITENGIWAGYLVALGWIFPVIMLSIFFFKIKK